MAVINDPTAGTGAKVSLSGAVHITAGGDGFPTYITRFGNVRYTAAIGVSSCVWAMRAPATKTIELRMGLVRIAFDGTATAATSAGIAFVRFSGADPGAGTLLTPVQKNTTEVASTTIVREATAAAGVTLTGATVATATAQFGSLWLPLSATGTQQDMELSDFTGLLLAPGEGLALIAASALPIGISVSGWVEYSER